MNSVEHSSGREVVPVVHDGAVLDLLSAQINSALHDLERPQLEITRYFNDIIADIDKVKELLSSCAGQNSDIDSAQTLLAELTSSASKSIVEIQSFDRVEQRLRNVNKNLHLLADCSESMVTRPCTYTNPELLDSIKSNYSLEHEMVLHSMMECGSSRAQMLGNHTLLAEQSEADDIELF